MKRIAIFPIFGIITVFGCGVGQPNSGATNQSDELPEIPEVIIPDVTYKNGLLNFGSSEDFEQLVTQLEVNVEAYDDAFLEKHKDLSPEKLDDLEDKISYSEFAPLISLEQKFSGFKSLRSIVEIEKEELLLEFDNEDLTRRKPIHQLDNEVVQSLLNEKGEISINKVLFKVFPNGVTYAVKDGDLATLAKIKANASISEFKSSNVVINNVMLLESNQSIIDLADENCSFFKKSVHWEYPTSKHRIKYITKVQNFLFYAHYVSKSINYVKKRRKWRKRRAWMRCSLSNSTSELCDPNYDSDKYPRWSPLLKLTHKKFKKKRRRAIRNIIFGIRITPGGTIPVGPVDWSRRIAEKNKLKGNNSVAGITREVILTW